MFIDLKYFEMYPFLILIVGSIILPLNFENILLRYVYAVFSSTNTMEKI
jgi:hypothetical protein